MPRLRRSPPTTTFHTPTRDDHTQSDPELNMLTPSDTSFINTARYKRPRTELSPSEVNMFEEFKADIKEMLETWKADQDYHFSQIIAKQNDAMSMLVTDIAELKLQTSAIQKSNAEIKDSMNFINQQYEDLRKEIADLQNQRQEQRAEMLNLERKIQDLQLRTRSSCLEIRNIPQMDKEDNEDLIRSVSSIGKAVGMPVVASELRDIYRLPGKPEDKDLYVPLDSEAWLIRFLRPCKFYPESAYDLIKRYYGFKLKHSKHYEGLIPSKETNVFIQNVLTVLPTRDQYGRRVLVLELGKKWKPSKCSLDEVFKGCVLFLEAAMLEPETQICGAVVIFDMDGLSMQHVLQFTPSFANRIVDWLQEAIPLRIKGLYIINQPFIFEMVFKLFKPFLKEKLRSRIVFMGSDKKMLHEYISPKCLPDQYGGTLNIPSVTGGQWLELLLMCDKEFSAINSYGYKKK